jgi:hypothetical protein
MAEFFWIAIGVPKMHVKITGFDKLTRKLEQLKRNAERIDGTNRVPPSELLSPRFLQKHTRFPNAEAMFAALGISMTAFAQLPDADRDDLIRSHTTFQSWSLLQKAAAAEWVSQQLHR